MHHKVAVIFFAPSVLAISQHVRRRDRLAVWKGDGYYTAITVGYGTYIRCVCLRDADKNKSIFFQNNTQKEHFSKTLGRLGRPTTNCFPVA